MKKIFLLLLLFAGIAEAQIVNIPDANFKAALLSSSETNGIATDSFEVGIRIDTNNDGEIQETEALAVSRINLGNNGFEVASYNIADLTGIESFINVTQLNCRGNQITNLDVSALTLLEVLDAAENQITAINLTGLVNLKFAYLYSNQIQSISLEGLIRLNKLDLNNNNLTSINLTGLADLGFLNLSTNQLTAIDFLATPNISELYISNNQLTALNLSGFTNLIALEYNQNQVSTLDLSNLSTLQYLACGSNGLTSLDVSTLVNLNSLTCSNNSLTVLNVGTLPNLLSLNCAFNNLTSLDLSATPLLQSLDCSFNQLTSLDVSNLMSLYSLHVQNNSIATLNIPESPYLFELFCQNNAVSTLNLNSNRLLAFLDVSNCINLETLFLNNGAFTTPAPPVLIQLNACPNLRYICVQEEGIAYLQSLADLNSGASNVVVNSYCSFSPSGFYNTIAGNIKFDADNNGCDASDEAFPYLKVNIVNGDDQGSSFVDNTGNYKFYTQAGTYTVTPAIENAAWFNFTPPSVDINFPNVNNNSTVQDFCLAPNGVHPDVSVVIAPILYAQPGSSSSYQLVYTNKGNQTLSGTVDFNFNDDVLNFATATVLPSSTGVGNLQWNYTNLRPFESVSVELVFNVNASTDTPPVNIDDVLSFSSSITPIAGDETPSDNAFAFDQTVVAADVLNDIICLEGTVIDPSYIGDYLHYMINFENVGTLAAENTVIRFEIDPLVFDINSLQLLDVSDIVYIRITGNVVEFIFQNINLEIGGHGHILLKIRTNPDLDASIIVSNRASIFYDYNAAVDTGTVNTVFQTLTNTKFDVDASVVMAPNPASNEVLVKADHNIQSIQIYDVQGRIITASLVDALESKLDISRYNKGTYLIKITTAKGIKVQKLLKK
ncbi:T9SS type A sorting domain-containing protein [Flavobacterium sp.]|uniref:DUF7619 domain-containing protein n=1 Tax=Flavobacterium sp. TaxID=239 RepID=UPI00261C91E4|nr:T9SS type A sorting domain-containing protein [Flavobacterium sp.]